MVFASDHLFWVVDIGHTPAAPFAPENGLVVVTQPGAAVIFTGVHTGYVSVEVQVLDSAPEQADESGWDEVVEVSMQAPRGRVSVLGPMAYNRGVLPELTPAGPGDYRLRVHARGRDTLVDGVATEPVEDYLIVVWPAQPATERRYKQSDGYGADLRRTAARTRSNI